MKFEVNRDMFSDAVSFVVKLLPQRPTLPILSGVVLETSGSTLQLSTFDYEVSSRTAIDATVDESGAVLVQGRLLADIASRLPDAPVQVERDDRGITITCGRTNFTLPTMPIEEFPALPTIEGTSGVVSGTDFSEAISQVVVAASREDVAPVITGVHLTFSPTQLQLVATDRYRVAVREIEWQSNFSEGDQALVPSRTLGEVGKSFAHADEVVITLVSEGDRQLIAFTADGRTVTSLLIKGNFPAVSRLFPAETPHFAVLQGSDVIDAVRRMQLVLEREQALRFSFSDEGLKLDAVGAEQAAGAEELSINLQGDDIVVSLKPQFLLEGVGAIHSAFVKIAFTNNDNPNKPGPVLLTGQTSLDEAAATDTFRYLLQPNLLMR
ncbi:DNA polymerase III subunit beta [Gulosibacter sp. ACHW.36C]|uniref:Beta sliding clamp n=1 Tax=Gulosibacter sediminis TaxID=1729695 RepID=A0ABY4MWM7_9MICO|nr:DNA polymerase III subunit beta [Gulosibacter sediminis]UQN14820.1 DNA polymerase III subunit beta [Gulosibacter sediminis]